MENFFSNFQGESPALQSMEKWAFIIYHERELIKMYIHLLLAALFPIYIGAHASLYRPPSAKTPSPTSNTSDFSEEEEKLEVKAMAEGLQPSDAILFPVLAAITLSGLYLIIKWLEDPSILNKILTWYTSGLGIFGVGKLAADALNVGTTFVFPSVWSDGKDTYFIDALLSRQVTGNVKKARTQSIRQISGEKMNPFPGYLSNIKFSEANTRLLWSTRALLRNRWTFKGYIHGICSIKSRTRLNDAIGFIMGTTVVVLYNFVGKTWWLTNLIGFGFCYGTFQLMSPTTFWTGSLVLVGLFIYDIVMVFYTPMMVTVATTLDVPIKLVFPGPVHESMLGLGDVVLPGILIALALRFDLYLHYLHLQRTVPHFSPSLSPLTSPPPSSTTPFTPLIEKAPYLEASGKWGERFWTRRCPSSSLPFPPKSSAIHNNNQEDKTPADGARFKKTYFHAGIAGYVIGMLVTEYVLIVFKHAQPALLYLVPGVLGALWGTAWVRGEGRVMWAYTEDGSLDDEDDGNSQSKEKDGVKKGEEKKTQEINGKDEGKAEIVNGLGVQNIAKACEAVVEEASKEEDKKEAKEGKEDEEEEGKEQFVFCFSLSGPKAKGREPSNAKLF